MNEIREIKEVLPNHIKALVGLEEFIRNNPTIISLYEAILDTRTSFQELEKINRSQMRSVFSGALVMTAHQLLNSSFQSVSVQQRGSDKWYNVGTMRIFNDAVVFDSYDYELSVPVKIKLSEIAKVRQDDREITL